MSRPEDTLPPELFYSPTESRKYTASTRIQTIQAQMTRRALELLDLQSPSLILDVGCGSGLSGAILGSVPPPAGPHTWIGMDISPAMLSVALTRPGAPVPPSPTMSSSSSAMSPSPSSSAASSPASSTSDLVPAAPATEGDLFLADMGAGIPFRPGTFDAAISISALQWLCSAPSSDPSAAPAQRLRRFFAGLHAALRRGARAVCQFYPRDAAQRALICSAAVRAGFGAGVLEDAVGSKAAKLYLVLTVGGGGAAGTDVTGTVRGLPGVDVVEGPARREGSEGGGRREWIRKKKARRERQGKTVKAESKYTGRKRRPKF